MPIITLEILSNSNAEDSQPSNNADVPNSLESSNGRSPGLHFLTDKVDETNFEETEDKDATKTTRNDLLEYMMRNDGSVVCKLCGEILQSRTHWYRHKYKLHVVQPLNPAPLFQCEQCLVYFKSRKGYIGHIASKHSEVLSDSSPVLTNTQAEAVAKEKSSQTEQPAAEEKEKEQEQSDPELAIPRTCVLNYQSTVVKQAPGKCNDVKKPTRRTSKDSPTTNSVDMEEMRAREEKRSREEKLVADIIDRVRRECEAQGAGGPARRGYSRRYVMHT